MRLVITDAEPEVQVPKTKIVKIGNVAEGKIEPTLRDDRLHWHACIKFIKQNNLIGSSGLMQGFGPSPSAAVADAVLSFRNENVIRQALLQDVEQVLGCLGWSDEKLKATIAQL